MPRIFDSHTSSVVVPFVVAIAALAGCYTGPHLEGQEMPEITASATSSTMTQPTEPAAPSGLACDVANLIADKCARCHGGGSDDAPAALVSRANLLATAPGGGSYAALSVERMRDKANTMPPDGSATEEEVAVLQKWIDGGNAEGTCSINAETAAAAHAAKPVTCTSGKTWTQGNEGSESMHPGVACINCHSRTEGPRYTFAGTVFATSREPDDCNGHGEGDTKVIITGADGVSITLAPNEVGNFTSYKTVALPYTAKVVRDGQTRAMKTAQLSGDCNSCHSASDAPKAAGRIAIP